MNINLKNLQNQKYPIVGQITTYRNRFAFEKKEGENFSWTEFRQINYQILNWCTEQNIVPPKNAWKFLTKSKIILTDEQWKTIWNIWCLYYEGIFSLNNLEIDWNSTKLSGFFSLAQKCVDKNFTASKLEEKVFEILKKIPEIQPLLKHVPLPESTMHLDIYLPKYKIAIEVQGTPHYLPIKHMGGALTLAKKNESDAKKRKICQKLKIQLCEIYCLKDLQKVIEKINPKAINLELRVES